MSKKDKILLIVESPAKAKTISKYIGKDFIVRASYGHIFDLSSTGPNNFGINIQKGFVPKYTILNDKKDKVKSIVSVAKTVSKVYIASDPDREGEAIAWHLAEVLKPIGIPIKRVIFNEITKNAITKAVNNPGELNKNLYDAQQGRRILDRIVGFSVSPVIISKFGPDLSAGRVQSIAVKIIADREKDINKFIPKDYWNISANLSDLNKKELFIAKYEKSIFKKEEALTIQNELNSDKFIISSIRKVEKKRNPLPPLITSSLASVSAGRYGFSTSKTMKAAQLLYEAGYITYMRTDSVRNSPESILSCREWLCDNSYDIPDKENVYAIKGKAQDAHEAIRPTDVNVLPQNIYVPDDEQKVYRLIWERFIASQMLPARYDTVNVTIKSSSGHILKANGRTLTYKGWLDIVGGIVLDKDIVLPVLNKGQFLILTPPNVILEDKKTQPPPRYSEKTLIKELEKNGIGRPSTYANIMSKITTRSYVKRKKNTFYATELGIKITDNLSKCFSFMKIDYTSLLELNLDKIASGQLTYKDMLTEFYSKFREEMKETVIADQKHKIKCPMCGGPVILKKGKYGHFLRCYEHLICKGILDCKVVDGKIKLKTNNRNLKIVEGILCPNCGSKMTKRSSKYGKFYGCIEYPKCLGIRNIK